MTRLLMLASLLSEALMKAIFSHWVQRCLPRKGIDCLKCCVMVHSSLITNSSTGKGVVSIVVQYLIVVTSLSATRSRGWW